MEPRHRAHWLLGMPRSLSLPPPRLHDLLARAAERFPEKPATVFEDRALSDRGLHALLMSRLWYFTVSDRAARRHGP